MYNYLAHNIFVVALFVVHCCCIAVVVPMLLLLLFEFKSFPFANVSVCFAHSISFIKKTGASLTWEATLKQSFLFFFHILIMHNNVIITFSSLSLAQPAWLSVNSF